jgi:hypothetical protein
MVYDQSKAVESQVRHSSNLAPPKVPPLCPTDKLHFTNQKFDMQNMPTA